MKNGNLAEAKRVKNDEFYTKLTDIEKELGNYKDYFKGKIVFCNCDDPEESNFWKYFQLNFGHLGLKKLISTHFETEKSSYKLEMTGKDKILSTPLKQNGDFRSLECIEILKECDVVVTNPPFSLFREYIAQLMSHDKDFIIIGSMNAITYKETFNFIQEDRLWLGCTSPKEFVQPDGTTKKFGNIIWYTNLDHKKRNEELILVNKYNPKDYPSYDGYDVINTDKVVSIPIDYDGIIGVPITFLEKYNPKQFEILGIANSARWIGYECITIIKNRKVYNRILVKKR